MISISSYSMEDVNLQEINIFKSIGVQINMNFH